MLIDTHAHIYLDNFDDDIDQIIKRSMDADVRKILLPNIDVSSINRVHNLCESFPEICFPMMGLHPCSVHEGYESELAKIHENILSNHYIAIGEIGLDYYWDKTKIDIQKNAFIIQLEWARTFNLPIVIHSRDSIDDILDILENEENIPTGVFHCFTGSLKQAQRIMDLGYYMGIGGVLTFKNSGLDQIVVDIPLSYLILETDSPYLTPTPHRGKRNESSYVKFIAEKLAQIKSVNLETIKNITTQNAENLFELKSISD